MSFMKKQIYYGSYFEIDTTAGVEIVPADLINGTGDGIKSALPCELADYLKGKPLDETEEIAVQKGWFGRMSASGYLDCTAWSAYKTQEKANQDLDDMYGEEEEN